VIEVDRPHRVGVQLEAAEVHDPREPRGLVDDDLLREAAGREAERDRADPVGPRARRALLVEALALGALDVPHEDERAVADAAERSLGDAEVVADQIELRDAGLREVRLARVGDRHLATADADLRGRLVSGGPGHGHGA
jgi:hypothetical protein